LIACERKKDKGADAIAEPPFAAEGVGKVLACSMTPSLEKIRSDAEKVKAHFKGITKIIFATPSAVSNELSEKWAAEIPRHWEHRMAIGPRRTKHLPPLSKVRKSRMPSKRARECASGVL